MKLLIEKGVPVPARRGRGSGYSKYPFAEMEVGDSVFIPDAVAKKPLMAARSFGRIHNKKIVTRKVDGGYRVWLDSQ